MKDFFAEQDRARRMSGRLVLLFVLALTGILMATYFVALFIDEAAQFTDRGQRFVDGRDWNPGFWRPGVLLADLLVVLGITGGAGLYRLSSLSRGGSAVAGLLGARLLPVGSQAPAERQLLNVVEEMALASGIPVPQVFVLDEEKSINAFAAGYGTDDAAVTVTRGLLEQLDRDEIQGVVAHEFGHIFSGDMRLKCRLIAALFGIAALAIIGKQMLSILGRTRSRGRGGGSFIIVLLVAGVMLTLIGYIGLFMGRVIKAALSRQREYLADASAVQFTRNPAGLAGALSKIARGGSQLKTQRAEELSHLFFAAGTRPLFSRLLATHPPLEERIRRLDPRYLETLTPETAERVMRPGRFRDLADQPSMGLAGAGAGEPAQTEDRVVAEIMGRIGRTDTALLSAELSPVLDLPVQLREAVTQPFSAAAFCYACLLLADPAQRQQQYSLIREHSGQGLLDETVRLEEAAGRLTPKLVLPALDLALPALRVMNDKQRHAFTVTTNRLVASDFTVSVREFAIARVVLKRLRASSAQRREIIDVVSAASLEEAAAALLSVLAYLGEDDPARAEAAFAAGYAVIQKEGRRARSLLSKDEAGLDQLERALAHFTRAPLKDRGQLLEAGIRCVLHDGRLDTEEAELIRATATTLDLPLAPFGQALA